MTRRPSSEQVESLIDAAREARDRAYAPYSGFRVGAAVLADDGRVFAGANVENAAYPLGTCAERNAVGRAVSEGARWIKAVAIAGPTDALTWPCGGCRQVLYEFGRDLVVISQGRGGARSQRSIKRLLPDAFGPHDLERPR
ncbi:MAG TPA: cytidine deaminase [Actinomycetota bacterium]|nr:cytidine deaminase [Actinomycetota bacterium]